NADGAGNLEAGLDLQILAHRQHVERRIVERTVEGEAGALDRQPLSERRIGAADGFDRPVCDQIARFGGLDAELATETGIKTFADEPQAIAEIEIEVDVERHALRDLAGGRPFATAH